MLKGSDQETREGELEAENTRLRELLVEATRAAECAQAQAAGVVEKTRFLDQLLEAVEQAVIATDLSGRVLHWNRYATELYGWTAEEAVGRTVLELKAAPESQSDAERLLTLLQAGEKWSGELLLRKKDGTTFPAYVSDAPIHDAAGRLIGIVGISFDNSARKLADDQRALVVSELHHRVKNTLATVQAIMGSTARSSASVIEFQQAFTARIASLARTHSLIAEEQGQAVPFEDLLRAELEPYDDGSGKRIVLSGPRIILPPELAVPIGMAIHELTTNAAKHGALAEIGSSVEVKWSMAGQGAAPVLCWEWREHDGQTVTLPTREGFGSRLLNRVLAVQTGADVKILYETDGLRVHVAVPLSIQKGRV